MKRTTLPNSDIQVSQLCCGTGSFGTALKGADTDRLVAAYLEAGGNCFDTAHCYAFWEENGDGASERELTTSLRRLGALDQAVIATKGGHPDAGERYRRPDHYLSESVLTSDISDSLKRLDVERIDLYFLHRDDPRVPIPDILGVLNREIERGRLRALGASNWSVARITEANLYARRNNLQGFVASQIQWSLATPNWKHGPEPTMRYVTPEEVYWHIATGLPIMAYAATAGGYFSNTPSGNAGYDNPDNRARRERAIQLAAKLNCTPTQIAFAWLLHQKPTVLPLFGTTNPAHLTEILGALQISLTPKQTDWLLKGDPSHQST